jgi:hypothetical protein
MKNIIRIILCVLPILTNAQSNISAAGQQTLVNRINAMQQSGTLPIFNLSEVSIEGSKFFNDVYALGELLMTKDRLFQVTSGYKYRVDELKNEINALTPKGEELALLNEEIVYLKLYMKGKEVLFMNGTLPNANKTNKLLQVLFVGKNYQLFKLGGKEYTRLTRPQGLSEKKVTDKYANKHHYYLQITDGAYSEIKLKQDDIINTIPSKKNQLTRLFDGDKYKGKITEISLISILQDIDNQ